MGSQTQPHKVLLKTWSGWESGIGFLPEAEDEDGTKGMYFAEGVLGIRGELRPAPYFREAPLYSHIIRQVFNNTTEAGVLAMQIPSTGQDAVQPTIASFASDKGTTASAGTDFYVGSFPKQATDNTEQTITNPSSVTPKGFIFWSSDGEAANEGTSTGTTTTTMTDSGQSWVVDEWIGGIITMPGTPGGTMTITDSDATSVTGTAWSNAGDPSDTLDYTISMDGESKIGRSNFIGFADAASSGRDRAISWNSLNGGSGATTEVSENSLTANSDLGTIGTITETAIWNNTHGPGSFTKVSGWADVKQDELHLISIISKSSISPVVPTITGAGQTWENIGNKQIGSNYRLTVFRFMPTSNASGWVDIEWSQLQTHCHRFMSRFANVKTTGTNGEDAIVQIKVDDTNSATFKIGLNTFNQTGNGTWGTTLLGDATSNSIDNGSGFTEIAEAIISGSRVQHQWRDDENTGAGNPSSDWATSGGDIKIWGGAAVEIGASVTPKNSFTAIPVTTPLANRLQLMAVDSYLADGVASAPDAITGNGLTWTLVQSQAYDSTERMLSVWKALEASPSGGNATIDFTTAGAQTSIRWAWSEFASVDTTAGGGTAVSESATSELTPTGTALTVSLSAITAGNAVFGAFGIDNADGITEGTDFTDLWDVTDQGGLMTQVDITGGDTTVDATAVTSGLGASIGIEILFAAAGSNSSRIARRYDSKCIIFIDDAGGSTPPSATLTAVNGSTDFRVTWTNNDANTSQINYMLFGGDDVECFVKEWANEAGLQSTESITGVPFPPSFMYTIGAELTATGSSPHIFINTGATDGTNMWSESFFGNSGVSISNTKRYTSKTHMLTNTPGTSKTKIVQFDSTGFTVNHTASWPQANLWASLCITGVNSEVGQYVKTGAVGDESATSMSIASEAIMLSTTGQEANDTVQDHAAFMFGAASALTETAVSFWIDEHGNATPNAEAEDNKQGGIQTTGGEDIVLVILDETDGAENVIGGLKKMDIGEAAWIDYDDPDSQDASKSELINYIGFSSGSNAVLGSGLSVTTSANVNQQMIVAVASLISQSVTSVVFNDDESLTLKSSIDTTTYTLEFWTLQNPTISTTAAIKVTTSAAIDVIVGAWLIDDAGALGDLQSTIDNSMSDGQYISSKVDFTAPVVEDGLSVLKIKDLVIGVSVDDSPIIANADATTTNFDDNTAPTPDTLTDSGEAFSINAYKGKMVTASTTKTSMVVDTNTAIKFSGFKYGGWTNGVPSGGDDTEGWEVSGSAPSSMETPQFDIYESAMHMVGTSLTTPYHKWQAHWFFEEAIGVNDQYLYISRGRAIDSTQTPPEDIVDPPVLVTKIDLRTSAFGSDLGTFEFTDLVFPGQVARYKGNWFLPASGTTNPRKLTVGSDGISNDELTGPTDTEDSLLKTVEHIANGAGIGGFQLVGSRAGEGWRETISEIVSKTTVNPELEAGWASYFGAGDRDERAAGLSAVAGGDVFLNKDGLWSYFSDTGRSSLIFEDFKVWRTLFDNVPISPWRGGLLIPHPSGLLFWTPGQLPINIGFDFKTKSFADPPTNVTNYNRGRYLGVVGVGDYIYTLYQPDITSVNIHVLCGYLNQTTESEEIAWQSLGTTTLYNPSYNANIGVSLTGRPISTLFETPTLWFNNGNNMNYMYLDDRAGPFRLQRPNDSGFAFLPELFFPERQNLSEMIIYTQGMRKENDSWQVSMFADNGEEIKLGAPIYQNGRTIIKINRHDVYRVMFKLTWTSSAEQTTPSETPAIKRIELYGQPTTKGLGRA